jgi:hypothetical protein
MDKDRTRSAGRRSGGNDMLTRVGRADCHERAGMDNALSRIVETLPRIGSPNALFLPRAAASPVASALAFRERRVMQDDLTN